MQHNTKSDDIQFYIPPNITVPTGLVLMVDGVRVDYEHYNMKDMFIFYVHTVDKELVEKIANKIVARIQEEHNDVKHGVTWRTIWLGAITDDTSDRYGFTEVRWKYRVKDSY